MKRLALIGFAGALVALFSFRRAKEKKTAPPGTVRINDSLFVDKTEVANIHWYEFLSWYWYRHDTATFMKMKPDISCYPLGIDNYPPFFYNSREEAWRPVVGITYEQAVTFCQWRSDRVNELISRKKEHGKWAFKKVVYRLPNEEEWMFAASAGTDREQYPFGFPVRSYDSISRYVNFNATPAGWDSRADWIAVDSFQANAFGLKNMCGNAAEMVLERGLAKGGWYDLPLDSCRIRARQHYYTRAHWLGFRCVATVTY